MAQKAKIVDLRRGFLPTDPNAFPENLVGTQQEDSPEDLIRVIPYEGYNFLPTEYGYRSYFGTASELNLAGLTSRCSDLLMFQSAGYVNMLIALCEDGIWTSNPATAGGTWTHEYTTTFDPAIFERWTHTIIGNAAYFYQEAGAVVYKLTNAFVWSSYTPSFLTMSGQKGIFRAGGRLGFWDADNSVSWSAVLDHTDFTPAIITTADNTKFRDVVGNIVSILSQGDGYVIYSTKTIVGVRLSTGKDSLWNASVVANNTGISYATHACLGNSDATHFAYTTTGLYSIGVYNQLSKSHEFTPVLTETIDFIREMQNPVRLFMSEGRFLFISLIDAAYIDGIVSSQIVTIPGMTILLAGYSGSFTTLTSNQGVSLINEKAANPVVSYGMAMPATPEIGWDGTYHAAIDKLTAPIYFTAIDSTTHFGAVNNYTPLKHLGSPYSFLNSSELTVEGALNTWDVWLEEFIAAQAAVVASLVAAGSGIPGRIYLTGTGKDKLIQTDAGTLLNTITIRRYFTDAKRFGSIYDTWNPSDK